MYVFSVGTFCFTAPPSVQRYDWTGCKPPVPSVPPARAPSSAVPGEDFDEGPPDPDDDWDYHAGNRRPNSDNNVLEAL